MLTKRIIPCLDVMDGKVVKGTNFSSLKDAGDPVLLAKMYSDLGADELVFLDITASSEKRKTVASLVRNVSKNVFIPFTVGGGISSVEDIRALLNAGADKVSINTAAFRDPLLLKQASDIFGSQCIVVAIDAKRKDDGRGWEVMISAGKESTGVDVIGWAKDAEGLGAGEILLTSIDCDGTSDGYDNELTRNVCGAVNIPVIASGGAGSLVSIYDAFNDGKADAALAASIFHYGRYTIADVKGYLEEKGVEVRR